MFLHPRRQNMHYVHAFIVFQDFLANENENYVLFRISSDDKLSKFIFSLAIFYLFTIVIFFLTALYTQKKKTHQAPMN